MTEEQTKELRVALLTFVPRLLHGGYERSNKEILVLPKIVRMCVESGLLQKERVDQLRDGLLKFIVRVAKGTKNGYEAEILPEIVEIFMNFDSMYPN